MKSGKTLFDRKLLRARRTRAARQAGDVFLFERVATDVVERILDINREFSSALLLGDQSLTGAVSRNSAAKLGNIVCADFSNTVAGLNLIADEEQLPFAGASFDFVFSGLGLHAVNAVPQAMMEIKRILKPDGLFIGALFGGETLKELRHALYEAEDRALGRVSPRVSPMIDVQQAAGLLQKAGFAMPVVDRDLVKVNYSTLDRLFGDLKHMGERNILTDRARTGASKRLFDELAHIYQRDHQGDNGKLAASFDILWMTGWCPHANQPKPLKPGSAKSRLSDALGVKEHKL